MKYREILKIISKKENVSTNEIEREMENALALAGIECSAKDFIEKIAQSLSDRLYIV